MSSGQAWCDDPDNQEALREARESRQRWEKKLAEAREKARREFEEEEKNR